ncbi:UNVERIFIED_CONTAM: Transcription factor [Sesamum angustifolium]|uniref:Transcription factor n=1 Tax=Sesamum angustifolium TaxID=2727405 RepID=A0AAW2IWR0_9LAMI
MGGGGRSKEKGEGEADLAAGWRRWQRGGRMKKEGRGGGSGADGRGGDGGEEEGGRRKEERERGRKGERGRGMGPRRRRRGSETKIEICSAGKPGLLLSTVTTLEASGLEIQHCVISCFNDFAMQASCSHEMKHSAILDSEDIKQALCRNAGYG